MRRALIGGAAALLVLAGIFHKHLLQHAGSTPSAKRLVVGEKVPDFDVTDISGSEAKDVGVRETSPAG